MNLIIIKPKQKLRIFYIKKDMQFIYSSLFIQVFFVWLLNVSILNIAK